MTVAIPCFDLGQLHALRPAFDAVSYGEADAHNCLPLYETSGDLVLVVDRDDALSVSHWAGARLAQPYSIAYAARDEIAAVLVSHSESIRAMDSLESDAASNGRTLSVESINLESIHGDLSHVVRLTNSTLYDAYRAGASDVHLEATADGLRVKYRIDGVLTKIAEPRGIETAEQVISRIKVMAELDIAERRIPQDGRIKISIEGREVDLRVSIMPSIHGEDAVLRILDKHALTDQVSQLSLDYLGFDDGSIEQIRRLSRDPYGMLLVTGPTGSGKTTTLYAVISEINDGRDKIVTIEDPVEYQLPDVLQIPVNEKKGLSFARGLRSILRHDPDKIMVGEIRDAETAQIAVQSALTGHLVLTTVHANSVFDVISRFLHMGIPPHSFVSAINGILAQRLIRTNCPHCRIEGFPSDKLLVDSGIDPRSKASFRFKRGRGCTACLGTGFKGRRAVAELLRLTDEMREAIISGASTLRLREAAAHQGMNSLRDAALNLVRQGDTTLEEINRVTFVA